MKKINIIYIAFLSIFMLANQSCKKDPVVGGTAVQKMAGEWWVTIDGGTGEFGNKYYKISTYNTAGNQPDSIWMDDIQDEEKYAFVGFQGKIGCNLSQLTFGGKDAQNVIYDSKFTVTDGKILPDAAHGPGSKDKTDSISFNISFSDEDPVIIHKVTGYERTGFQEDDH